MYHDSKIASPYVLYMGALQKHFADKEAKKEERELAKRKREEERNRIRNVKEYPLLQNLLSKI